VVIVDAGAGDVVHRAEVGVSWERVGGSEQCGGPSEAHVAVDDPE